MTILRSRTVAGQAAGLVTSSVERALDDWRQKIEAARVAGVDEGRAAAMAESSALVRDAERRAATAEADADARLAARQSELEQRLGTVLTALGDGLGAVASLERSVMQAAEGELVRLATAVAGRILHRELDAGSWVTEVVAAAVARIPDRRGVAVRMQPDDAAIAREQKRAISAAINEQAPGLERLEIFDDPALERGACILASQGTRLDASVHSSWERLTRRLLEEAPHSTRAVDSSGVPSDRVHPRAEDTELPSEAELTEPGEEPGQ